MLWLANVRHLHGEALADTLIAGGVVGDAPHGVGAVGHVVVFQDKDRGRSSDVSPITALCSGARDLEVDLGDPDVERRNRDERTRSFEDGPVRRSDDSYHRQRGVRLLECGDARVWGMSQRATQSDPSEV